MPGMNRKEVANAFVHHQPHEDQVVRYKTIRSKSKELAEFLMDSCPESRELSVALSKLREVVMWANASIACNE